MPEDTQSTILCNLNNIIDTIVNGNDNNDNEIATVCQLCRVYIFAFTFSRLGVFVVVVVVRWHTGCEIMEYDLFKWWTTKLKPKIILYCHALPLHRCHHLTIINIVRFHSIKTLNFRILNLQSLRKRIQKHDKLQYNTHKSWQLARDFFLKISFSYLLFIFFFFLFGFFVLRQTVSFYPFVSIRINVVKSQTSNFLPDSAKNKKNVSFYSHFRLIFMQWWR